MMMYLKNSLLSIKAIQNKEVQLSMLKSRMRVLYLTSKNKSAKMT